MTTQEAKEVDDEISQKEELNSAPSHTTSSLPNPLPQPVSQDTHREQSPFLETGRSNMLNMIIILLH